MTQRKTEEREKEKEKHRACTQEMEQKWEGGKVGGRA